MEGRRYSLGSALRGVYNLARTGWMLRGVPPSQAETVASHSYASAVIAFELAVEASRRGLRVDPYRAAAIALLHDLAESIIGDISRRAGLGEAKRRAEEEAYEALDVSEEAKSLYREFEDFSTPEARVARIAELLATHWMAVEYSCRGFDVGEIAESTLREAEVLAGDGALGEALKSMLERLVPGGCGGGRL